MDFEEGFNNNIDKSDKKTDDPKIEQAFSHVVCSKISKMKWRNKDRLYKNNEKRAKNR